jgi:class 3 adenylate cyclase
MVVFTLWALLAWDITIAALPPSADKPVLAILFISFIFFWVEMVLEAAAQGQAYFEFYFWLDLFTTLSLIPDILLLFTTANKSKVLDILTLARAGRAARASSRASRIIRFIKLLNAKHVKTLNKRAGQDIESGDGPAVVMDQSAVAQRFTESTTRRVVALVILVLILFSAIELIGSGEYISAETGVAGAIAQLSLVKDMDRATLAARALPAFLSSFQDTVKLTVSGEVLFSRANPHRQIFLETTSGPTYELQTDAYEYSRMLSISNIVLVMAMIVVLAVGNFFFIQKADDLVIGPVERMTNIVRQLARNPLAQLKDRVALTKNEEMGLVLGMFRKLVGLVQVGFGEAGSTIIAENLATKGNLDVMRPGKKVFGIFGFCDIRNFTDMTEILNEDCMFLVNSIAAILHSQVAAHKGSANKNIGDAFLLVWKEPPMVRQSSSKSHLASISVPADDAAAAGGRPRASSSSSSSAAVAVADLGPAPALAIAPAPAASPAASPAAAAPLAATKQQGPSLGTLHALGIAKRLTGVGGAGERKGSVAGVRKVFKNSITDEKLGARALNSFLHTMVEMGTSKVLRNIGRRAPKYAPIKMGFGLHVGWAIEGAVGSTFKIDATYLSPHVNMAARLESLTKTYSANILMSGEFVALLPPTWSRRIRLVDIITVKGSSIPLEIYVIDDQEPVPEDDLLAPSTNDSLPLIKHRAIHAEGMAAFRKGSWDESRAKFEQYLDLTGDPPTRLLLDWMAEVASPAGGPPPSFEGFRRLTAK